jgi:hypothetical protein
MAERKLLFDLGRLHTKQQQMATVGLAVTENLAEVVDREGAARNDKQTPP